MRMDRLRSLQHLAQGQDVDYTFIVPGANLFYFTGLGISMSERPIMAILPSDSNEEPLFYCPSFEADKVRQDTSGCTCITYTDEEGPYLSIAKWLKAQRGEKATRVAFEYQAARLLEYNLVKEALPTCDLVDARPLMAQLRMKKDAQELALMERAGILADLMMEAIRETLAPGVKESVLRQAGKAALNRGESDVLTAFISVASGPRGALPHAGVEDRTIERGDLVVVDLGARYQGYCSDITRTLPVGPISEELQEVYALVLAANEAGRKAAKAGVTCQELDRVTREVIVKGGYGPYFTHRTGHGLGIEVHEEPYIVEGNRLPLEEGMVFTIEPGIYLLDQGGVRIEDDVVITATGSKSLTQFPRNLVY